jgi:hypothetical protein
MPRPTIPANVIRNWKKLLTKVLKIAPIIAILDPSAIGIFGLPFHDEIKGFIIMRPTVIMGITLNASAWVKLFWPSLLAPPK